LQAFSIDACSEGLAAERSGFPLDSVRDGGVAGASVSAGGEEDVEGVVMVAVDREGARCSWSSNA